MFLTTFIDPISDLLGQWSLDITIGSIVLRILLSVVASAIIGCERSSKRHAAGLRTFVVVSLASTIAAIMDDIMGGMPLFSVACIVGVAIISVNTVLFSSKSKIKGLTTSVGLWATTILGLSIGFGLYAISVIFLIFFVCSLSLFPKFEYFLKNRSNHFEVNLELKDSHYLQNFVATIRELGLIIDDIEINSAYFNSGLSVYSVSITINSEELKKYRTHKEIIKALESLDYIHHIEEMQ